MPTFVFLSTQVINLDRVVALACEPDIYGDYPLRMAGKSTFKLSAADADLLRQALHAARWLPPGGPGPLTAELVAMVRRFVDWYDEEGINAVERGIICDARTLLARVESEAAPC